MTEKFPSRVVAVIATTREATPLLATGAFAPVAGVPGEVEIWASPGIWRGWGGHQGLSAPSFLSGRGAEAPRPVNDPEVKYLGVIEPGRGRPQAPAIKWFARVE